MWRSPKNIPLTTETINGKQYRVGRHQARWRCSRRSRGRWISARWSCRRPCRCQARSTDPFDAFFRDPFGRNVNHDGPSEPLKINVDPLPAGSAAGVPRGGGAVRDERDGGQEDHARRTSRSHSRSRSPGRGTSSCSNRPSVELPAGFRAVQPRRSRTSINRGQSRSPAARRSSICCCRGIPD